MPSPLNSWSQSRSFGSLVEQAFREIMEESLGLVFVAANEEDVKAVDLKRSGNVVDLKCLQSPYPRTPTPAKLTAETHLTLDHANLVKYEPSTEIWMVVDYRDAGVPTAGIYMISAGKVLEILEANPSRKYKRSSRTSMDKEIKIAVSTEECGRFTLPGMTPEESASAIIARAREIERRPTTKAA